MPGQGKIGVLIEEHFDAAEYRRFNEFFPARGYEVEYLSHLWDQPELRFRSNPTDGAIEEQVTVRREVNDANPADYRAVLLIGAYAMDRLRYQPTVRKGQPNQSPAVRFLRRAFRRRTRRSASFVMDCGCSRRPWSAAGQAGDLCPQHRLRRRERGRRGGLRRRRDGRGRRRRQPHLRETPRGDRPFLETLVLEMTKVE